LRILIDIGHPAHVHFFKNPIRLLQEEGHQILITSRDKECAIGLLDGLGLEHRCLSVQNKGGIGGMAKELVVRNRALMRVAREYRPDVMTGVGGIFVAQVGRWLGIPSVVFYDTENAYLQNALTYPFAAKVVVPECYRGWTPKKKTIRYRGYHELSYLHPDYFTPDREKALANGLAADGDTFLIRLVSWKANHDIGEKGWSAELLDAVVSFLDQRGKVIISAEGQLPQHLERYRFRGQVDQIHHLMAHCRAYVGESATMASECAVLGVPSVYVADVSRGYVNEQSQRYGLARIVAPHLISDVECAIDSVCDISRKAAVFRQQKLVEETEDVAALAADIVSGTYV
jgi:predicted glycosyltransferase